MQIIDNTLSTLKTQRDEIEADVTRRREEFEAEIADKVGQLREINGFIRAIEKQQTGPTASGTAGGPRAPRGENREKIIAAIAGEARTTAEISDTTGIGRGSTARTLNQLVDEGAARKDGSRYVAIKAAKEA